MDVSWKRFILFVLLLTLIDVIAVVGVLRGPFDLALHLVFFLGALCLLVGGWLWVSRLFDFSEMDRIEEEFADNTIYILRRSYPTPYMTTITLFFVAVFATGMLALWSSRWFSPVAQATKFAMITGLSAIFVAFIIRMWRLFWRRRSALQSFDSKRIVLTPECITYIWRNNVIEVRPENTKLIRIFCGYPATLDVDATRVSFSLDSRMDGFMDLTRAVLRLTDKVKVHGRIDKLPPWMHELLEGKKMPR